MVQMAKDIRINVPQNNIEKFKQVFLYILEKVGAKHNVGLTVLYKLLYFIDFDYYELYEEQLMGLDYIKNKFGPTPVSFERTVNEMINDNQVIKISIPETNSTHSMIKYLPMVKPDLSLISAKELEHINNTLNRLSDKSANEITEYSHKDIPWICAEYSKKINYDTVFYRNESTSVREYES